MEHNLLGLHLPILHIYLIPNQHNVAVRAYSGQVLVPLGNILVGDPCTDIEHDDPSMSSNVVSISQTTQLLLPCCVPYHQLYLTLVGEEVHWVHLTSNSSIVLFLKLSCQMSLHKCGLPCGSISHQYYLVL